MAIDVIIDGLSFHLIEETDFSFLSHYGKVFNLFDQTDSGNISFSTINEKQQKFFIKVAGAKTLNSNVTPEEAVNNLRKSVTTYKELQANSLIQLIESHSYNQLFYLVFEWVDGECLFDHWNFDYYQSHPEVLTPKDKIALLSITQKEEIIISLLNFMSLVEQHNYIAVDFYDGSLIYHFDTNRLMICDIDFFHKGNLKNMVGENYWGTKRMKSPEEYRQGTTINQATNTFNFGALLFNLFSQYDTNTLQTMYQENRFIPPKRDEWLLSNSLYTVLIKATQPQQMHRYQSILALKKDILATLNT